MANSEYENIKDFLSWKSTRIQRLDHTPIIIKWLESPSMRESLRVIDKKVKYLLENYQVGGESKLIQWFLSGDTNFVSITAERYIIDYLILQNSSIKDNLGKTGIDAKLKVGDENIGIEINTLNGFRAEWILIERLSEFLSSKNILDDKTVRITYDHKRILKETKQNEIHQYIKKLGTAIDAADNESLKRLDVSIEFEDRWAGCIAWNHSRADGFPWFKYLTDGLFSKISERSKERQLMECSRNIIFVGVNHIAPSNWAIPSIFEEIGAGGNSYKIQIESIVNFWSKAMQNHQRITGLCFFYYSLDRVNPFYPLRILWSNKEENLPINL
jgi:hypothetical protein